MTHSTNPRGGVVHALELADALTALGHEAVVHAPDPSGEGFFRRTRARTVSVPARPVSGGLVQLVQTRIDEYVAFFESAAAARYDVLHAQDSISANALAFLAERGRIPGFVRTVHHIDGFDDPLLSAWQNRAITAADHLFCVSPLWRETLARDFGRTATLVGNGVDRRRFTPVRDARDAELRSRLGIGGGPVFLAVGGVEARKNSVRILQAFLIARRTYPAAQLVVAGGASLLDHGATRRAFDALVAESGLGTGPGRPLLLTGPLPDADMPALYRLADALVFPSLREGFGLVVLEAMACGTPVVVSRMPPFTEYLAPDDGLWADPHSAESIADAMLAAVEPATRARLARAGAAVARRLGWDGCALAHLQAYIAHLTGTRLTGTWPTDRGGALHA
nr:MSMEG_0565 family glycosyltransferase [Azospirillum sp. SYSU D00513]